MPKGKVRRKDWLTNPKPPKTETHFKRSKSRFLCHTHGLQPLKKMEVGAMLLACDCIRVFAGESKNLEREKEVCT
jgi:hypothetical protein